MSDSLRPAWTVTHPAPPSMGFSRQEYWSRLPFHSPGIFPIQRSNRGLLHCRQILYCLSHHFFDYPQIQSKEKQDKCLLLSSCKLSEQEVGVRSGVLLTHLCHLYGILTIGLTHVFNSLKINSHVACAYQ